MDPDVVRREVETAIDAVIEASEPHEGLFPSILDRETGEMLAEPPGSLPGQRDHDRAPGGCNPLHDVPLLRTAYALDDGENGYADAADRYLERFATHCTDTATGLFPWAEHAYWDLVGDCLGASTSGERTVENPAIHDHLRKVPSWMWARIHDVNPDAVHDFVDGLDYHWRDPEKPEYNRHAPITAKARLPTGGRSCDFPRHSGHYVFDYAFAYTRVPHPEYVRQIDRLMDYWWTKREDAHGGLLRFESRGRSDEIAVRQTLSLATSLLDAAALLDDHGLEPDLRARMREYAGVYCEGVLAAPHDPDRGVFLSRCRERDLRAGEFEPRVGPDVEYEIRPMTIWGDVYSGVLAAPVALLALCAHRRTGDQDLLEWAASIGETYVETPFPADGAVDVDDANAVMNPTTERTMSRDDDIPVSAGDAGLALGLLADLYDVTGDRRWLREATSLADEFLDVYLDGPLPRAAATADWYENQCGTGYLLYGLARTALLARDGEDCPLGPDYSER